MDITIFDEDVTTSDTVGTTKIKISSLCVNGGLDDWFPIQYRGKQSGQIHLKGIWKPAGAVAPKQPGTVGQLAGNVQNMA